MSPGIPKIVPSLGIHVSPTDQSCRCTQHSQLFTVTAAFGHYFLGSKKETQLYFCSVCQDHGPEPGKFPNGSPLPRNTCATLAKPKVQKDCGVQDENCSAEHSVPCHTKPRETGSRNKSPGITHPGDRWGPTTTSLEGCGAKPTPQHTRFPKEPWFGLGGNPLLGF